MLKSVTSKIPVFTRQYPFWENWNCNSSKRFLGGNILRRHFEFDVLDGDMVSFTTACPYSAWERAYKFLITLPVYAVPYGNPENGVAFKKMCIFLFDTLQMIAKALY